MGKAIKRARRRAGRILYSGSNRCSLAATVMRIVFKQTIRLPQRKAEAEQRLLHGCRRNIDVLDPAVKDLRKLFGHLTVRQCLRTREIVDFSFVSIFGQGRDRRRGNIAHIDRTNLRSASRREELALRADRVSESQ